MATDEGIPSASTTLLLVLSGLLMAVLGEFVCYIFVYSKPQFIKLQQETTALWREFFEIESKCLAGGDGRYVGRSGKAAATLQAKIQKKTKALNGLKQKGYAGAVCPFNLFFPLSMLQYTKPAVETTVVVNAADKDAAAAAAAAAANAAAAAAAAAAQPPLCTTSAVFMLTMLLFKTYIQKILGVDSPASFQQQAALASAAN